MSQLQKRLMIIIACLLAVVLAFDASLFYSVKVAPNRLKVDYQTLKNDKIPLTMNDVSIVYFTDLQYGAFENKDRTKKVFDQIKELSPDILIFGGDLFDKDTKLTNANKELLTEYLASIDAPLGKFAVWGEKDQQDEQRRNAILNIYKESQIEVLDNHSVLVYNQGVNHIRIIGLSADANVKEAASGASDKEFNLLIAHQPDTLTNEELAQVSISYALAGHAHDTQVNFPILGPYKTIEGAKKLNRSLSKDLSFEYELSAGTGCTNIDMRYNAVPEIHYFLLKH